MNDVENFIHSLKEVLSALDTMRTASYRIATLHSLPGRLNESAGRRLRRAAAAKVTELDTDVMGDIMKLLKKLGKESTESNHDMEDRFKLTLNLLDYAVSRKIPTAPDQIIWVFNKLYAGLGYLFLNPTTKQNANGGI